MNVLKTQRREGSSVDPQRTVWRCPVSPVAPLEDPPNNYENLFTVSTAALGITGNLSVIARAALLSDIFSEFTWIE